MDQARRAEREIAAGRDRGPLHGIPYGAKDLLATVGGIPTTWGAAPFRDQRFDDDATVISEARGGGRRALRQARHGRAGGRHGLSPAACLVHRARPQSVESRRLERRLVERLGLGRRGGARAVRHRLGDVGVDSRARGQLRRRRAAADLRPREPPRRDGAVLDARQAGPAGPHRGRLRPRARGHRGRRRGRSHHERRGRFATRRDAGPAALPLRRAAGASTAGCDEACARPSTRSLEVLRGSAPSRRSTLPDLPCEAVTRTILHAEAASAFEDLIESGAHRRPHRARGPLHCRTRATPSWPRTT